MCIVGTTYVLSSILYGDSLVNLGLGEMCTVTVVLEIIDVAREKVKFVICWLHRERM